MLGVTYQSVHLPLLRTQRLLYCPGEAGAVYVQYGDMVSMGGTIVFDNNTAHMDGGELMRSN